MKTLVLGSGGREHALVRALNQSPSITSVFACPGSDAIALEATRWHHTFRAGIVDGESLLHRMRESGIDLVVIGPDQLIVDGWGDYFRHHGFLVFGAGKLGGQLEGSKSFAKNFMFQAGIPCGKSQEVSSRMEAISACQKLSPPWVIKADGLAAGKGVRICEDKKALEAFLDELFTEKKFGPSGEKAIVEEFLAGWEMSYLILTNGKEYVPLALTQDHKQLLDGGRGPNTGGMGTIAPITISAELEHQIHELILKPTMTQLQRQEIPFNGVLFLGLMITANGPRVLEYNTRFGDPEAQVILPLLDGDWGLAFKVIAEGKIPSLRWKRKSACCVVLAAPGYPEKPELGALLHGVDPEKETTTYWIHAGTRQGPEGSWIVSGGRTLNSIAVADTREEAIRAAYTKIAALPPHPLQLRTDVGRMISS